MRKTLVRVIFSVGVLAILAQAPPAAQAVNCLGGAIGPGGFTTRRCDFKRDDGIAGPTCATFSQSGVNPQRFLITFATVTLRCTCEATGSFLVPKFDAAKDFLCGEIGDTSGEADAASGKIVGRNIKKGQYLDGFSPLHQWVFECVPDPVACP